MSGLYNQNFSPARPVSPQIRSTPDVDSNQYLSELLAEHQKIAPFMQVLPICSRLLNQEILRLSGMMPNHGFGELDRLRHRSPSPMASSNLMSNVAGTGLGGWNGLPQERLSGPPGMTMDWQGAPASPSSYTVKRILRLEIPVDAYPSFNFVGRLLGPRGNSLKRVEATTGCRVFIRGKGSIKDPEKEDKLRGRPGYEHLNEPLHILIEADLPANVVDTRLRQAQEIIEELLQPVIPDFVTSEKRCLPPHLLEHYLVYLPSANTASIGISVGLPLVSMAGVHNANPNDRSYGFDIQALKSAIERQQQ